MLLFSVLAFSEEAVYELTGIEVSKNREVPVEVIKSVMESKVGSDYLTETMVEDYKRIKNLEYIENVVVYPRISGSGVSLEVEVEEVKGVRELLKAKNIIPLSERETIDKSLIVSTIEIFGNRYISKEDIMKDIPVTVGAYFSRREVLEGQKKILNTGYFRDVKPEVYKYGEGVLVRYTLIENPVITGIKIAGNTVYTTEELMDEVQTKSGEIYNINTLRADKDRILAKYHEAGYILTEVKDMGLNNNYELEMFFSEGIVRDIQLRKMVTKQKGERRVPTDTILKTKDFVIDREIDVTVGKPYNINDFQSTNRALMRSGHFKSIKPEYKNIPGDPDGKIVTLLFDEERTASLQGAISYGSEVGLLGSLSVKDSNWKGKGQELSLNFEKSDSDYSKFSIDFQDPWIRGTDRISWGWSLYKTEYDDSDSFLFYNVSSYGLKLNVGKGLSRNVRFGVGTKFEYVTENDEDGNETDAYALGSIYPSLVYDNRNSFLNATEGEYLKLQLETGLAGGGGEIDGYNGKLESGAFGNITLEARKYHRGFWKKNTFAYRAIGGIMTDSTKESQRFRVGGGSTLRGYGGSYYKGTKKFTASIENRTQVTDVLGLVLFVDAGRAWNQNGIDPEYNNLGRDEVSIPSDIGIGAGFGLRINTPLGPLRFDFGWPMGGDENSGMEFYFNMGHSF